MWPFQDPSRRCPKIEEWPEADRTAWERAIRKDHVLDDPGPACHWSPATLHKNRRGYGRWLTFLLDRGLVTPGQRPADRVTKEVVRQYLRLLEDQALAPYTLVARICELRAVIAAMAPDRDWRWLTELATRLRRRAKPVKNKRSRMVASDDLFRLGLRLIEDAEMAEGRALELRAVQFRDGLMIALLAARQLRASNLASISLGRHLVHQGAGWILVFEAHEMKNRRSFEIPFPCDLEAALERYLDTWRPVLCQGNQTDRLWITRYGRAMGYKAVYARITKVTRRVLKAPLNPHLFRDCGATSVAIEDPEHVHIIAAILGHASHSTAERYYNQAQSLEAGRHYQEFIATQRREMRRSKRSNGYR